MTQLTTWSRFVAVMSIAFWAATIAPASAQDCNSNGVPDAQDIDPLDPDGNGDVSADCNANLIPDECELPIEVARLMASDASSGDTFGWTLAIDGDTLAVGAYPANAVYIFDRGAGVWQESAKLVPSDGGNSRFGHSIALSADTLVVGAPYANSVGDRSGAVYVFRRIAGEWQHIDVLVASDAEAGDELGYSVAYEAGTIVSGAIGVADAGANSGAAYVFREVGGIWNETTKLLASDGAANEQFGASIQISGDTVVVGARFGTANGVQGGTAYVFREQGTSWNQIAKLTSSEVRDNNLFGEKVAISGDMILVSAPFNAWLEGGSIGAAFVFHEGSNGWEEVGVLRSPVPLFGDYFGGSLSIHGDTVIVGNYAVPGKVGARGGVYIYRRVGNTLERVARLIAQESEFWHGYGSSVAIGDGVAFVGSPYFQNETLQGGAISVFDTTATATDCLGDGVLDACRPDCDQSGVPDYCEIIDGVHSDCNRNGIPDGCELASGDAQDCNANNILDECEFFGSVPLSVVKHIAADGAANDRLGESVAIDGDAFVVGVPEDDDNGESSGSAYVFRQIDDVWTQEAKLLASDGAPVDLFGDSVAIHGDTIVVGAYRNQDAGPVTGSVYVFERLNGVWVEVAKLTASDADEYYEFGKSVAVFGDTILVGAPESFTTLTFSGAVYVFRKVGGVWQEITKLASSVIDVRERLGFSVAMNSEFVIAGAPAYEGVHGSVTVFQETNGSWEEIARIEADHLNPNWRFGESVAILGDTIFVGVPKDATPRLYGGSVRVFERDNGVWTPTAVLRGSDTSLYDDFGKSVDAFGDMLIVGASPNLYSDEANRSAYVFRKNGANWNQIARLTAMDPAGEESFGVAVAIHGDTAIVTATRDDDAGEEAGALYVHDLSFRTGDCNDNGVPDECDSLGDLDAFVVALLSDSQTAQEICLFDADRNGVLDGLDIWPLLYQVGVTGNCDPGDASIDGFVAALIQGAQHPLALCLYDGDGNDVLDGADIALFVTRLLE